MSVVIRKMKVDDLVDVKDVDLMCWNDLLERQYGIRGKMSPRTDSNLLSYLHSDVDGAFVASDIFAGTIGLCFSHTWGSTGWVGPLSVLPSYQARGVGKELLKHSLRFLEDQGCVDIGLETMPENATNLGMYLKVGLRPEGLLVIFGRALEGHELEEEPSGDVGVERFSESPIQDHILGQVRRVSNAHRPGLDYSKEVLLTKEFSFGDTLVATSKGKVKGFSIVHTVQKRANMQGGAIRALVVDAGAKADVFESLLSTSELMAADEGLKEISVPVPVVCRRAADSVFSRGYQVIQSFERLMWLGSSGMNEKMFNLCTWSG
ncbi:MAG: GNAT family N-acetyltransferase [Candidatus Thermoplasmatota archaeon]|nr:GNAT family N-acetyltransferase [Candidatus Thermoplasmatota archaeon]